MREDGIRRGATAAAQRQQAEDRARVCLMQLLCAASALRQGLTLGGGWWTLLVSLLPGLGAALLAFLAMRIARAATLTELFRRLLGRGGGAALSLLLGALLLLDAAASLDAIVTLFTDGVGSRGTPVTLALLTGGALALCLWGDGLARGTELLRWPLLAGCAVALAAMAPRWRMDHLFPLQGAAAAGTALRGGFTAGWPLLLLLTIPAGARPAAQPARLAAPVGGAVTAMLCVSLMQPPEGLTGVHGAAQRLMLPWRYVSPPVQLMMLCLLLTGLFLAIAAAVQLGGEQLCAPWGRRPPWLAWGLLGALVLTRSAPPVGQALLLGTEPLALTLGAACAWSPMLAGVRRLKE